MTAQAHFYRLHENGWISVVMQREADFAAWVAREAEGGRVRTAPDLLSAKRLADSAVPAGHACSSRCSAWFEITDPSRKVDFTTNCPRDHAGSLSYTIGDVVLRLNTLSFWCLRCGRSWPATDEQRRELLARIFQSSAGGSELGRAAER
jgi:hypothetical protein